MLHHISFAADDPMGVAEVLARLVGGSVQPFAPLMEGAVVWSGDGAGTAFEIYPRGTELLPDPAGGPAVFGRNALAQPATSMHASVSVDRTTDEVLELAREAGWQAGTIDRGGFDVVQLWVENRVLLDVMTPAMLGDYLRAVNAPHIAASGADYQPLTLAVHVPMEPATAWQAWVEPGQLQQWWGGLASARVDVRVGGVFELIFRPDSPAGSRGSEQCRILSYVPGRMLSFTWNTPPHLPVPRTHTWVVVSFRESGEGTEVELVHNGLLSGPGWDECRGYFRHAWRRVLHRMSEHGAHVDLRTVSAESAERAAGGETAAANAGTEHLAGASPAP